MQGGMEYGLRTVGCNRERSGLTGREVVVLYPPVGVGAAVAAQVGARRMSEAGCMVGSSSSW
jgi:hypothetical protein